MTEQNKQNEQSSNVLVCVRIRPLQVGQANESPNQLEPLGWSWNPSSNTITQEKNSKRPSILQSQASESLSFTFDHLFPPEVQTKPIFDSVCSGLVTKALQGFHGTILAYGQTSSGKTYTMSGSASEPGIVTLAVETCFQQAASHYPERDFRFRATFLEVYNEAVRDLLSPADGQDIKIQSHPTMGTIVTGAREVFVDSLEEVWSLLAQGAAARSVACTEMNSQSSRAHTLFQFIIESKLRGGVDTPVRTATLNLVDLAGSENAKMTGSAGERAREARHINQSLLTLSLIIQRLSEESSGSGRRASSHMPYRDSKLTRLLEHSLDGSGHIVIVCNLSPSARCVDESINTLKFASRAKKIKTNAQINEVVDDKVLLKRYRVEIEQLKLKLEVMSRSSFSLSGSASMVSSSAGAPWGGGSSNASLLEGGGASTDDHDLRRSHPPASKRNSTHTLEKQQHETRGGGFFFEIDDEDDQETTLKMISEMEDLIKRVATGVRQRSIRSSESERREEDDKDALAEDDSLKGAPSRLSLLHPPLISSPSIEIASPTLFPFQHQPTSPRSTGSSPPQYAPTWRDSISPNFMIGHSSDSMLLPDEAAAMLAGETEYDDYRSRITGLDSCNGVNGPEWRHAFSHNHIPAEIYPANQSQQSDGHTEATRCITPPPNPEPARTVAIRVTPDSTSRVSGDPGRFGFVRRTASASAPASPSLTLSPTEPPPCDLSKPRAVEPLSRLTALNLQEAPMRIRSPLMRLDEVRDAGRAGGGRDRTTSTGSLSSDAGRESALRTVSKMLLQLRDQIKSTSKDKEKSRDAALRVVGVGDSVRTNLAVGSECLVSKDEQIEALTLELRLKEADTKFLQSELDEKNHLLGRLTEGLREVEATQNAWLTNNDDLSSDLETAIIEIESVNAENVLLRDAIYALERAREADAVKFSRLDSEIDTLKFQLVQYQQAADSAPSRNESLTGTVEKYVGFYEGLAGAGSRSSGSGSGSGGVEKNDKN